MVYFLSRNLSKLTPRLYICYIVPIQLHVVTPVHLGSLLVLCNEAVYLDLPELAHLCATLRRYPNFHVMQLLHASSQQKQQLGAR